MNSLMQNPVALLLAAGFLVGLYFPMGKLASEAGVAPVLWAMVISVGVVVMLLPIVVHRRHLKVPRGGLARYAVISGLISFVLPNVLIFSVIPNVGSGYAGLMFALSPVFTLAISLLFKLKGTSLLGGVGILLGLVGAAIVTVTKSVEPHAPTLAWIVAALLIPVVLASGNVYRSVAWPSGASPDGLAFWSHFFSVLCFGGLIYVSHGWDDVLEPLISVPWLALAQAVVAGLIFPLYFRLQLYGGPVLLSQIGYIAAAVGLVIATLFLDEQYSFMTWLGAGVIAVGILATVKAQWREQRRGNQA